jgi:hypothetical protein
LLKESYVEHDGAKVLIAEIMAGDPSGDEYYDAKVKVLSEEIQHHVEEEERRMEGLFAQARKAGLDMDALGDQLAARKAELTDQFKSSGIPEPTLSTMDDVSVCRGGRAKVQVRREPAESRVFAGLASAA